VPEFYYKIEREHLDNFNSQPPRVQVVVALSTERQQVTLVVVPTLASEDNMVRV
jgi:hypothetical protein